MINRHFKTDDQILKGNFKIADTWSSAHNLLELITHSGSLNSRPRYSNCLIISFAHQSSLFVLNKFFWQDRTVVGFFGLRGFGLLIDFLLAWLGGDLGGLWKLFLWEDYLKFMRFMYLLLHFFPVILGWAKFNGFQTPRVQSIICCSKRPPLKFQPQIRSKIAWKETRTKKHNGFESCCIPFFKVRIWVVLLRVFNWNFSGTSLDTINHRFYLEV